MSILLTGTLLSVPRHETRTHCTRFYLISPRQVAHFNLQNVLCHSIPRSIVCSIYNSKWSAVQQGGGCVSPLPYLSYRHVFVVAGVSGPCFFTPGHVWGTTLLDHVPVQRQLLHAAAVHRGGNMGHGHGFALVFVANARGRRVRVHQSEDVRVENRVEDEEFDGRRRQRVHRPRQDASDGEEDHHQRVAEDELVLDAQLPELVAGAEEQREQPDRVDRRAGRDDRDLRGVVVDVVDALEGSVFLHVRANQHKERDRSDAEEADEHRLGHPESNLSAPGGIWHARGHALEDAEPEEHHGAEKDREECNVSHGEVEAVLFVDGCGEERVVVEHEQHPKSEHPLLVERPLVRRHGQERPQVAVLREEQSE
mmetsp:Transcript_36866/g.115400  ORF Transcript_36866/g.115400 Transcript_36866/m.115400 type:complete len:367 (-) Transcript_36866:947-2047(-)